MRVETVLKENGSYYKNNSTIISLLPIDVACIQGLRDTIIFYEGKIFFMYDFSEGYPLQKGEKLREIYTISPILTE